MNRVDIVPAGAGRFDVMHEGKVLLTSVRDPEFESCRALLALGVTGRLETFFNGSRSMTIDIERGAGLSASDGASSPLRIVPWRPFEERVGKTSVSRCTVSPTAAELAEAAV